MKRALALPLVFLVILGLARASPPAPPARPHSSLAAVRIKSHGASGTVIATTKAKSWILSCCHMFCDNHNRVDPALLKKALSMDGPQQPDAVVKGVAGSRVLAYDADLDLSLIELDNGPFSCVPLAPRAHKPSGNLLSMGYDEMKWPVTVKSATLLGSAGNTTYTQEWPWHGRSGGGLVDADAHVLIGVVQGYEVVGQRRGLYVSHAAVWAFLARHRPQLLPEPPPGPAPNRYLPLPTFPSFQTLPDCVPGGS